MNKHKACIDKRARNFQRLVLGALLLIAYIFRLMPMAMFVAAIMLISSSCGTKFTPFYQLYFQIARRKKASSGEGASGEEIACPGDSFACGLGFLLLGIGILLFYMGKSNIAWILVATVGALSILAATTGFCLGTAIYTLIVSKKARI